MKLLKKTITKDDGRALIYYHFPETASASQKQAFDDVPANVTQAEVVAWQAGEPAIAKGSDGALV